MTNKVKLLLALATLLSFGYSASWGQTPAISAPTPPLRSGSKVISIFSNAYADIAGTNFSPYWNQSTAVSTVEIDGNSTLKFTNFNYQGFEFAIDINALAMTHLHIDVWTANETKMGISPISRTETNKNAGLTPIVLNTWNSYDIKLSSVANSWLSVKDIYQFFLEGAGGHTVYIDNIYFYNNMDGDDVEAPKAFTAVAGMVGFNSIELMLNATDNSGAVFYEVTVGEDTVNLSNYSGENLQHVLKNLQPATEYAISARAKDYSGNWAENNPVSFTVLTKNSPESAPIPPVRPAHKVISIFSEAYTGIDGATNFFPYWNQNTQVSVADFNGDAVLKYDNFNYQGIELGSDINALPMTHLHIDVYSENETYMGLRPVSRTKENSIYELTPIELNTWNSFDIELKGLTNTWKSIADIFQFFLEGAGGNIVYIDNIYFYNNSDSEDTELPENLEVSSGAILFNSIELLLKSTDNSGAVNYEISDGTTTYFVDGITGIVKPYTIKLLSQNTEYTFEVSVSDVYGNEAAGDPFSITLKTLEAISAPDPSLDAADVISVFSNSYSNIEGTNFNPFWNQATLFTSGFISDNEYLIFSNLNYQGIELGSHVNVSDMNYLHVDVFTPNEIMFQIGLISPGKEKLVRPQPLNKNVWNSYDIPLSSFTGVDLKDVFQFKLVGSGGKVVLIDNLYFHNSAISGVSDMGKTAHIQIYPNPATNQLIIKSSFEVTEIVIRNLAGQVVEYVSVNGFNSLLDISKISSGSYLVTVKNNDGSVVTEKFLKL